MKALPKEIYVLRMEDGEDSYLNANENIMDIDEQEAEKNIVGTYHLIETSELVVGRTLIPVKPATRRKK